MNAAAAILLIAVLWGVFVLVFGVPLTTAVLGAILLGTATGYLAGKYL